jgi:hypothetical protein
MTAYFQDRAADFPQMWSTPPMNAPQMPPGYAELAAMNGLATDAAEWEPLMRDVLGMPMSMLPCVQWAVKANIWKRAHNPIQQVTETAVRRKARLAKLAADLTKVEHAKLNGK